jgi:hypothetical protein
MLRRAVLISSLLGVVSAAAALAFAPELTRVGRAMTSLAPWRALGFTPVPGSGNTAHAAGLNPLSPADTAQGKYCPFPTAGGAKTEHADSVLPAGDADFTALSLDGQSRAPSGQTEAICTGTTAPRIP